MEDFQIKAVICLGSNARTSKLMEKQLSNGLTGTYVLQNAEVTEEGHPLKGEIVPVTRTILNAEAAEAKANGDEFSEKQPLEEGSEITVYGRVDNGNLYFDAQGSQLESLEDRSSRLLALMGQKATIKA